MCVIRVDMRVLYRLQGGEAGAGAVLNIIRSEKHLANDDHFGNFKRCIENQN